MELNKHYNCFKFDTLDVVKDLKYDREIGREFYQKLSTAGTKDNEGQRRPLRISEWCHGIFNF
jgi:hypothetical protein